MSQGHALAYRRYSTTYVPGEDQARAAQAGLWAGAFIKPWDCRSGGRLDHFGISLPPGLDFGMGISIF